MNSWAEEAKRGTKAHESYAQNIVSALHDKMAVTLQQRELACSDTPVLLMVSGGSDSTALAYAAQSLHDAGIIGPLGMLHVNHCLRGEAADADAGFVSQIAELLGIPLFLCEIDVAGEADRTGENVEALARRERYLAADQALESLCQHEGVPVSEGRIFTAHTADDRAENFYMRSIVGTGPGGFRSMLYRNGPIARPFLDVSRDELRAYIEQHERAGLPIVCDSEGALWREDATNAHTDRFRAFVRHEIVPRAKQRNPRLLEVLGRTMNLIADEDDMISAMASDLAVRNVKWLNAESAATKRSNWQPGMSLNESVFTSQPECPEASCVIAPELGMCPIPLQRRVVVGILQNLLGFDVRIDAASVEAVLGAWDNLGTKSARVHGGYVVNIQGNLAVSANKRGVRIEPMEVFRARRKRK